MKLPIQLWAHLIFMVLMIIFIVTGIIKAHKKGSNWLNFHKGYALTGVVSGIIGFLAMVISKLINDYPHFKSNHSKGDEKWNQFLKKSLNSHCSQSYFWGDFYFGYCQKQNWHDILK